MFCALVLEFNRLIWFCIPFVLSSFVRHLSWALNLTMLTFRTQNTIRLHIHEVSFADQHTHPMNDSHRDCLVCGGGDDEGLILLCDRCDCVYHATCHDPPKLTKVLEDWFCRSCSTTRSQKSTCMSKIVTSHIEPSSCLSLATKQDRTRKHRFSSGIEKKSPLLRSKG